MIGRIKDIMRLGDRYVITIVSDYCEFDSACDVEITKPKKSKSKEQMGYFHALRDRIADAIGASKAYTKNTLLARYGQREYGEDGNEVHYIVPEGIDLMEREDIHTTLVGYKTINEGGEDVNYDVYALIRGTHTYSSEELSALINGTIIDAEELGIDTRIKGYEKHYTPK